MNIEITDLDMILNYLETTSLEPHDDYSSELTYKDQKILYKYIKQLQQENKQLKEQLLVNQTNEETFRLEMEDITKTLGLDEDTIFDDVKAYARSLKDNWNKLKEYLHNVDVVVDYSENYDGRFINYDELIDKMQELEKAESDE